MEMITTLFDASDFITRGECGEWTLFLITVYIASNLMIAIAYFIIPFVLIKVWRKRQDIMYSWMLGLFALFILMSGMTHITDITAFYWAGYRFYTLVFFLCGLVSLITAILLPNVIRQKLRLLSREQYHDMVNKLSVETTQKDVAIQILNLTVKRLKAEVDLLEDMKIKGIWYQQQENLLSNLRNILSNTDVRS